MVEELEDKISIAVTELESLLKGEVAKATYKVNDLSSEILSGKERIKTEIEYHFCDIEKEMGEVLDKVESIENRINDILHELKG